VRLPCAFFQADAESESPAKAGIFLGLTNGNAVGQVGRSQTDSLSLLRCGRAVQNHGSPATRRLVHLRRLRTCGFTFEAIL
jgi:hypothetical protein